MNKDNPSQDKRRYSSRLREEQAEQTRERILAAVGELLGRGEIEDFSFAAVAAEAGVSVPTVYRYFPSRDALFDGVQEWISGTLKAPPFPESARELASGASAIFAYYENAEAMFRTSMVTALFRDVHHGSRVGRDRRMATMLEPITDHLEPRMANAVQGLIRLLYSFEGYSFLKERFGATGAEAGEAIAWATRAITEQLERDRKSAAKKNANGTTDPPAAPRKRK